MISEIFSTKSGNSLAGVGKQVSKHFCSKLTIL